MADDGVVSSSGVLAICAKDWEGRFERCLVADWDHREVEQLHEELDHLVVDAHTLGEFALSGAALELSVYLSSFVEAGRGPDAAQTKRLQRLADAIAEKPGIAANQVGDIALAEPEVDTMVDIFTRATTLVARDDKSAPHILCVAEDPGLVAALSFALSERGIVITARWPGQDPSSYVSEVGVQCIIVDSASLGTLHDLERNAQALSGSLHTRPTCVAILSDSTTAERLRALRAGADHVVVNTGDFDLMGQRLAAILSARIEVPLKVMIIDDERGQRLFNETVLRRFGINTVSCANADEALREFSAQVPDVVLVDVHMPDVDGLALVETLLEVPGAEFVSILFLSGNTETETRFDALAAGGDDFLTKPIQPRHLLRAVLAHGKRAHRRRRLASSPMSPSKLKDLLPAAASLPNLADGWSDMQSKRGSQQRHH